MASHVCRQVFSDTAYVRQFLQIHIHLLIAAHGKKHAVCLTIGMCFVAVQNLSSFLQQGDVTHVFGFLPRLSNQFRTMPGAPNRPRPNCFKQLFLAYV